MLLNDVLFSATKIEYRLKVREWKKRLHANGNQRKAGTAILISDKVDFKDCHKRQGRTLHIDQGSIQKEDILIFLKTLFFGCT